MHDAKPGEEMTLLGYFKRMEEELGKKGEPLQAQKVFDEAKNMIREFGQAMKQDYEGKLGHVGGVMPQQQDRSDERFKNIETEVVLMKAVVASGGPVPVPSFLRDPLGYPHTHAHIGLVST